MLVVKVLSEGQSPSGLYASGQEAMPVASNHHLAPLNGYNHIMHEDKKYCPYVVNTLYEASPAPPDHA